MKLYKAIYLMANAINDWEEPTYVVAKSLVDVAEKHPKATRIEHVSDNVELIPKDK